MKTGKRSKTTSFLRDYDKILIKLKGINDKTNTNNKNIGRYKINICKIVFSCISNNKLKDIII